MTLSHFEVGSVNTALTRNVCCCCCCGRGHPVLSFVVSAEINFSLEGSSALLTDKWFEA